MTADPVNAAAPLARGSASGPGLARATVSVTTRLDESELRIPVHVVKGERDGPTVSYCGRCWIRVNTSAHSA